MTGLDPSAPLARALDRGRDCFNAQVAFSRRQQPLFDPTVFAQVLVQDVAPAVTAVEACHPDQVDEVTQVLFQLALALVPRDLLGPRMPLAARAWREVLPRCARLLATAPSRLAASLVNACHNLAREVGARPDEWLSGLAGLAGECATVDELLACASVLAWRAGLAHYRESALAVWDDLPEPLARASLGLDATVPRAQVREGLVDPWFLPGQEAAPPALRVAGVAGDFRGFGGPFLMPPRVFVADDRLWASDGEAAFTLHADCFGRTLQRAPKLPRAKDQGAPAEIAADGRVTFAGLAASLPGLQGGNGFAALPRTLAVTFPHSHRILLVARTGGPE